ncbi:maleylpyruvate isomerase family mycothiol-dependent enzyme [Terrabacter sp. LjRoot27]|uniref:maleylpyruvate isomerase family mycothiol-dependent enzyme n=1 Tax=Terrabacter sp. LjRoot27 TaxID=3342306 RepID=UPI003ECD45A5
MGPAVATPDLDTIWAAIDDQRLRTVAMLEGLTAEQWEHPSLCEGWTVRHVAAHLTLQRQHGPDIVRLLVEHPRLLRNVGLNRMIHDSAVLRAELPTDEIIARIRSGVGSRRHNSFVTPRETLTDSLVHAQDMAIPLGIDLEMRTRGALIALERTWAIRRTWLGTVNRQLPIDGYRLVATDADWTVGSGPQVTGPVAALLLLVTGRPVALARLEGDGAAQLKMQTRLA